MTLENLTEPAPCFGKRRQAQAHIALAVMAAPVLLVIFVSLSAISNLLAPRAEASLSAADVGFQKAMLESALENPPAMEGAALAAFTSPEPIERPAAITALSSERLGAISLDPISDYVAKLEQHPPRIDYEVARNDTLIGVFARMGIAEDEIQLVADALSDARLPPETWMREGQRMSVDFGQFDPAQSKRPFLRASIKVGAIERVEVSRTQEGVFQAAKVTPELTMREAYAGGTITTSLASTAASEGVSSSIVAALTEIYSYDVDFQRDIHPNDSFKILFTEYVSDEGDRAPGKGEVLFSELNFKGKRKTYYRHTHADGKTVDYYDANGVTARKFLMKTPIDGARLSSRFGLRRHPVLGYTKMHRGVDFAAPRGTPIYAAGDGTVVRANRFGTFGNYIKIRHANGYSTAYAHLNGFAKGVRKGKRVRQGQVIGYVGTTGRSTGPHLHYEVAKNGKQVNPMSLKVPTGTKLGGRELARFKAEVQRIETALASHLEQTKLADARRVGATAENGSVN